MTNENKQWINLHCHSHYSILDGFAKIEEYVDKAKARGDIGLGLTDHGTCAGLYEMIKDCQAAGIIPVPGFEAYVAPENPDGANAKHQIFYGPDGKRAPKYDVSGNGAYLHLTLFAYNNTGLKNLLKLTSLSWEKEHYYVKPRIDTEMLFKYHEGLIVTTGCPSSEISKRFLLGQDDKAYEYASRLHEVFGDNMYVEVMNHNMKSNMERFLCKKQKKLAKDLGLPLLATNDSHYANKSDAAAHECMICLQSGNVMSEPPMDEGGKRFAFSGPEYYMKTYDEMIELFPEDEFPGAVSNTVELVKRCKEINLDYDPDLWPKVQLPKGFNEISYFKKLISDGFKNKRGNESPEIQAESKKRIKKEFDTIHSNNFVSYFLIVHEYIKWAHDHGIATGSGRGSVGGSEIAYVMDIGDTDPIRYDLLFERFLSPGRGAMYQIDYSDGSKEEANVAQTRDVIEPDGKIRNQYIHELKKNEKIKVDNVEKTIKSIEVSRPGSAPDIDTDIHTQGRDELVQHVADTYGRKNVSNIITFGKFKTKNSLKSMATIFQVPFAEANKIVKLIPDPIDGKECTLKDIFDKDSARYNEAEDFRRATDNETWKKVIKMAMPLAGRIRETGVHACGLIISNHELSDSIPTQVRQDDGALLTQWTYPQCEALGLIKMDFLGLDTLDIIQNTLENIKIEGKQVPDLKKIIHGPMNDKKTYQLLQNAETTGIFQLGSTGMRDLLVRVKPTKFEDIAAITALYRPGPMKMNSHIQYADRKNGREKVEYIDPEFSNGPVEEVLKPTYGLCIPEDTKIYDGTRAKFVSIQDLNPMTSTTPSINADNNIELKPVTNVVKTGLKHVIKINRWDGHSIEVSTTHPILTDHGYVKAGELSVGDKIAVNRQVYPTLTTEYLSQSKINFKTGKIDLDNDRISSIENYNNKTLINIAAALFNSRGSIDKNGFASIELSNDTEIDRLYKILTILSVDFSIIKDNDLTKFTIFNRDYQTLLARKIDKDSNAYLTPIQNYNRDGIDFLAISEIEDEEYKVCYDIEVADNHNFLVDNVIVHNCIYQEQCMQLAQKAAGMSSYKADKLRKAMGKKKMKIMNQLRPEFIEGVMNNGYSERAATILWETIKQFGQYGFNKSHSMSYAINAYKTCYLKANYPAEFMSSLIQQNTGQPSKVMMFLQETKRMGLRVGPTNVNESQAFVAPAKDKSKFDIIYGFSGIKQVSEELSNSIIKERQHGSFKSVGDFVSRMNKLNAQSLSNLALAGTFDSLGVTRRAVFNKAKSLIKVAQTKKTQAKTLFDLIDTNNKSMIDSIDLTDAEFPYNELIKLEANCIGIFISGSPTGRLGELKRTYSPTTIKRIQRHDEMGVVNILGSFTLVNSKTRKNGAHSMAVRLEDDSGFLDLYLPNQIVNSIDKGSEILRRNKLKKQNKEIKLGTSKRALKIQELVADESIKPMLPISLNEPYCVQVKVINHRDGSLRIFVQNFSKIATAYNGSIPLSIKIPNNTDIKNVMKIINKHKGTEYIRAFIPNSGWKFFKQRVTIDSDFMMELEDTLGENNILTKGV